ncbi:MAG TPA: class I adenylate-forming enzyme family protein [Chthoniobacteraceae bacterium]|jgi:acyl-CoA synthetase (AMP-forming)/AMP-acid ligase II|nr:class I adenylate-forming enzyme family protein [Chthoniobacteraceae bacterium]
MKKNAILFRWAGTLEKRGPEPAILAPDGAVLRTFRDIDCEARAWAEKMGRLAPGTVVGIQAGNSPLWPALVLAAMQRGLIPLPLGRHMAEEEREAALATCGAGALIAADIEDRPGNAQPALAECDFLKLTSGTTSLPRAIRFTAAQLVADCDQICDTMGFGGADLNFGVIPFSHSYGFSNLITPLLCRGVSLVAGEDRLPRAILTGLARSGATVFPGMPVFFEKLAGMEEGPALPRLRLCISAGAPLPARVGEAFSARYGLKIHTFYGSSECGGIGYDGCAGMRYEEGYAGRPMRNVEIAPIGDTGQIAVRGPAVGLGYYPEPEPATLGGGQFIPADLVRIDAGGLRITGRAGDVINIAGRKLNPGEVEARLAECPGVRQVVVFGVASALRNEEAIACVSGNADAGSVLRYARSVLSGWQVPKDIWLVDEVPVNERGKISRRDLARDYVERRK